MKAINLKRDIPLLSAIIIILVAILFKEYLFFMMVLLAVTAIISVFLMNIGIDPMLAVIAFMVCVFGTVITLAVGINSYPGISINGNPSYVAYVLITSLCTFITGLGWGYSIYGFFNL